MRAWVGKTVVGIGLAHLLFGAIVLGDLIAPAFREGVLNTISASTPPERNMTYWFLMLGIVAVMLGIAIDQLERSRVGIPPALPWGFLVLAAVGCAASPASGFWLMWIPTVGLFLQRRASRSATEQAHPADGPSGVG